jgi:hypothetical protein
MIEWLSRIPFLGRVFKSVNPTPEDVRDFWTAITKHYDTQRVSKADSQEMKFVSEALGLMGIVDKQAFMERFTTVIDCRIYTPFEPGVPNATWSLWSQIRVAVHEHHHVQQDRASGGLGFKWNYLTSAAARAHYEAEAYRTDMVMEWRYRGKMPDAAVLAGHLKNYGCSDVDVEVVRKMLALSVPAIKRGAITSDVARWAINWLDERWER